MTGSVLRSIMNQYSSTMTDNTIKEMHNSTYDRAMCDVKNKTTEILRGANRYGVLELRYKMSDLIM